MLSARAALEILIIFVRSLSGTMCGTFGILFVATQVGHAETPTAAVAAALEWAGLPVAAIEPRTTAVHDWMVAPARIGIVSWVAVIVAALCAACFVYATSEIEKAINKRQRAAQWVRNAQSDRARKPESFTYRDPATLDAIHEMAKKDYARTALSTRRHLSRMAGWRLSLAAVLWLPVTVAAEVGGWLPGHLWEVGAFFLFLLIAVLLASERDGVRDYHEPDPDWRDYCRTILSGILIIVTMAIFSLVYLPAVLFLNFTQPRQREE